MKEMKEREYGGWTSRTYMRQNKKPLAVALSGVGRGLRRRDHGICYNVTNIQYKTNWNCHCDCPPNNKHILIKNL
jgi:hypothetical protein